MFAGLRRRRGHEPPVQGAARRRPDGPLDRLRHADALRLRHRPARGRGRVRDVRRRRVSSLADMEVLLDGLPLDRVSTSMTINSPAAPIWAMYIVGRREARRAAGRARGDAPERHPQGVRRPEGVPVPAGAVDAARDRHDRVRDARDAALEHDLDQRLPHPRGRLDGDPGAGVHDRRRDGLRRRPRSSAACGSTTSHRGCQLLLQLATATSSRRSRSSGRPAASGTS